jgi:hypothetical protein
MLKKNCVFSIILELVVKKWKRKETRIVMELYPSRRRLLIEAYGWP